MFFFVGAGRFFSSGWYHKLLQREKNLSFNSFWQKYIYCEVNETPALLRLFPRPWKRTSMHSHGYMVWQNWQKQYTLFLKEGAPCQISFRPHRTCLHYHFWALTQRESSFICKVAFNLKISDTLIFLRQSQWIVQQNRSSVPSTCWLAGYFSKHGDACCFLCS